MKETKSCQFDFLVEYSILNYISLFLNKNHFFVLKYFNRYRYYSAECKKIYHFIKYAILGLANKILTYIYGI